MTFGTVSLSAIAVEFQKFDLCSMLKTDEKLMWFLQRRSIAIYCGRSPSAEEYVCLFLNSGTRLLPNLI